jgi:phage/plasmid-like protein (TIGR03299 family)
MAHEIDTTVNANGAAVYANVAAWHGLGTVLDHPFTSAEALAIAGLDFTVEKRPLFTFGAEGAEDLLQLEEHFATVRTDTSAALGVVGPKYEIFQNRDAFASFDGILKDHGAVYETAGALRGGRQVFIAAKLPESFQITKAKGDKIETYLLGFNAHDCSGAIWYVPTNVRPVCANTVGAALGFGFSVAKEKLAQGRALRVLHTKNASDRIKRANEIFEAAQKRTLATVENARRLASIPVNERIVKAALHAALAEFGPKEPEANEKQAASGKVLLDAILRAQEQREQKRDVIGKAILKLVVGEYELVGKNAWAVYNGVTEYADHGIRYKGEHAAENRFQSIIGGRVDDFKGDLVSAIVKASGLRAA